MSLQRQLLASEKEDDKVTVENGSSTMAGDASPGSERIRNRTVTSLSSTKSVAAEKKPLMANQLIKEEDVEEGAVCHIFLFAQAYGQCAKPVLYIKSAPAVCLL